jgi:hypothetical protein
MTSSFKKSKKARIKMKRLDSEYIKNGKCGPQCPLSYYCPSALHKELKYEPGN